MVIIQSIEEMFKISKIQKTPKQRLFIRRETKSSMNSRQTNCQTPKNSQIQTKCNKQMQVFPLIKVNQANIPLNTFLPKGESEIIQNKENRCQIKFQKRKSNIEFVNLPKSNFHRNRSQSFAKNLTINHVSKFKNEYVVDDNMENFTILISQLYAKLCEDFIIQTKSSVVSMKKEKFLNILLALLQNIDKNLQDKPIKQRNQLHSLSPVFDRISKQVNRQVKQKKIEKLSLKSNIYKKQFNQTDFKKLTNNFSVQISDLILKSQSLQTNIKQKVLQLEKLEAYCCKRKQQLVQLNKGSNALSNLLQSQGIKLQQLQTNILQKQQLLAAVKQKTEEIVNFVEIQQQKKILHWVSEAYKKIQAELYDYGAYLQCNALASSLSWEPKPFRAVQKWVYEQMERVNALIMCEKASMQQKSQKMKEYITNTTRKFRTKDQEMMKITDFKTDCIKKYIKMMQKWMQNWELKQQYLVCLRQEFAAESQQIEKAFQNLQFETNSEIYCMKSIQKYISQLKTVWKKVELNYKLGNTFY